MKIDIERLEVDREYWDSVAPDDTAQFFSPEDSILFDAWYRQTKDGVQQFHADQSPSWLFTNNMRYRRIMIPRPEPSKNKWRGPEDGFPPVGTICEKAPHWHKCEIIAEHDGGIVIYDMHNLNYYKVGKGMIFRTIPSPRDEWLGKAREAFIAAKVGSYTGYEEKAIEVIYDAILSGELPIPGVE